MNVYPPLDLTLLLDQNCNEIYYQNRKVTIPNLVIPRVGQHKANYTLAVIRQFELAGAIVLNGSEAIGRSRDKLLTLQLLSRENLAVARTFFLDALVDIDLAMKKVHGPPLIIKVPQGTQGMGVILGETERSTRSILQSLLNQGQNVLVQEFIEEANGSDIRAIVLGGKLIAAMERTSLGDEFRSNVHRGGLQKAIVLDKKSEQAAIKAASTLDLQFAGVDILMSKRGPLIIEVNSSPGLEGIEKSSGVNVASKCISFLEAIYKKNNADDSFEV